MLVGTLLFQRAHLPLPPCLPPLPAAHCLTESRIPAPHLPCPSSTQALVSACLERDRSLRPSFAVVLATLDALPAEELRMAAEGGV